MTPMVSHIIVLLGQGVVDERNASRNTCESYAYAFKLLFEFAADRLKVPPAKLCFEQIYDPLVLPFLSHRDTQHNNGPNSRNIRRAAIKSFMRFMQFRLPSALEQIQRGLAIPTKKVETKLIKHLPVSEMRAILDAPVPPAREGMRVRAMLLLCFDASLRVSELIGLQLNVLKLQWDASI